MIDIFEMADDIGPTKVIYVQLPEIQLRGILVVDNVAAGPAIGGLRMATDVTVTECMRLARAMTLKNAAASLPHGGGKSVLIGDPKMPKRDKEMLIRAFASALRNTEEYIFGPDMGTNEEAMAWVHDELGRSVGLPSEIGGIPLDEIGATGWGISHATQVAIEFCDFRLDEARVAIQGFGAVGMNSAHYLAKRGATIIAVSDSKGTVYNDSGLDLDALNKIKRHGGAVTDLQQGKILSRDAIIDIPCDIWIPAARPDVLDETNANRLNTRLVVQGANIPFTRPAELQLHQRGVLCVPDFIANAGGVICAAMEYRHLSQSAAFETIKDKISHNTRLVLEDATRRQCSPRESAEQLAFERVKKAMTFKRWRNF